MSERIGDTQTTHSNFFKPWVVVTILVVTSALVATVWLQSSDDEPEQLPETISSIGSESVVEPQPILRRPVEEEPAADIPQPEPPNLDTAPTEEPLPKLADSDEIFKQHYQTLNDDVDYRLVWQSGELIQRWVTVIEGASRGKIIRGIVPIQPPKDKFPVFKQGSKYYLDEVGYERFKPFVSVLTSLDKQKVVDGFHHFRPLLEEAYSQLGFDKSEFDNSVTRLLDRVINFTPHEGAIELKATSVNYTFADDNLEKLSALEKLLIRMGPENSTALKAYASSLKNTLLQTKK